MGSIERNLVVVGGERFWHDHFPAWRVIYCRLQTARWLLKNGRLFIDGEAGLVEVHGVLWRVGVVPSKPWHRAVLDLIRLAGIPCLNSAESLLRGFDKLSMFAEMKKVGLPVIEASFTVGPDAISLAKPEFPAVLKIGNNHGGLGKARVENLDQWQDLVDVASLIEDYAIVEPFVDYLADVRCLAVAQDVWCMRRESSDWKVNRGSATPCLITPPDELVAWTKLAAAHLGASVVGLDFLQSKTGQWQLLECNDVPGFTGFPDHVREAIAREFDRTAQQAASRISVL